MNFKRCVAVISFFSILPISARSTTGIGVQLNRVLYRQGDVVEVALATRPSSNPRSQARYSTEVLLVGEQQHDIEVLKIDGDRAVVGSRYGKPVRVVNQPATVNDGALQLLPGERFFALLFRRTGNMPATASFAVGAAWTAKGFPIEVNAELTRINGIRKDGHTGVLASRDGVIEIATDHVIYHPRSERELSRFVSQVHGEILRTIRSSDGRSAVVVRFDPMPPFSDGVAQLRALMTDGNKLTASSERTAAMYAAALSFQLQGYRVSPDPVLQWDGDYVTSDGNSSSEENYLSGSSQALSLLPGMRQAWSYSWMFELDRKRVKIAFLDQGIAPNDDFRGMTTNSIWQCDLADHSASDPSACAFGGWNGLAAGPATVGDSFFNGKEWHGTGVVTAATGLLNNGFGGAGVAGQLGQPMLYRMNLHAYALEFGDAIRKATDDGASVINISAGYPCRMLIRATSYQICTWQGRARLVHDLNLAAVSLAFAACGPFAPACLSGAISQVSDFTNLIVEAGTSDLRDLVTDAVAYANAHGTVVVAGAGNKQHSDTVCFFADCSNVDADAWQIIPCIVSGVICVGAVDGTDVIGYTNAEFKGTSVAIWAPTRHAYFSPPDVGVLTPPNTQGPTRKDSDGNDILNIITATSGATPVVSGTVALLEAGRDDLNPSNPSLTSADRAAIPQKIRDLIVNSAVTTTATNDPTLTMRVVNPYAAMRAAFNGILPDADLLGGGRWFFDSSSGISGLCGGADDSSDTTNVAHLQSQQTCLGSILTIAPTGGPGGLHRIDTDLNYWDVPSGERFVTKFTVASPSRTTFGYVGIDGALGTPAGTKSGGSCRIV